MGGHRPENAEIEQSLMFRGEQRVDWRSEWPADEARFPNRNARQAQFSVHEYSLKA